MTSSGLLTDEAARYLDEYPDRFEALKAAAQLLEDYIHDIFRLLPLDIHVIRGRAKTPDSVRMKVLDKSYENPTQQMTDEIGTRVITLHGDQVDRITDELRRHMIVDRANSVDKRLSLGEAEFGYRSVHLIGRLRPAITKRLQWRSLRDKVFEVQVRSLLDHAWAEIDHQLVYKSGVEHTVAFRREFAAVAGTLEMVEERFRSLAERQYQLINQYRAKFERSTGVRASLDSARMVAVMELARPAGLGWRRAHEEGHPFAPGSGRVCVAALDAAGVRTAEQLLRLLKNPSVLASIEKYASAEGISPQEVSHLAVVSLAIGHKSPEVLSLFLPELANDASVSVALA